jgi:type I restriction enzyme S subunit
MAENQYKNTELEYLPKYPSHWKLDRIKDKTTAVVGGDWGNDPESDEDGENIIVLRVADLDGTYFDFSDLTIRKIKNSSLANRKINERSLVIEKSGGGEKQTVGRVGLPKGLSETAICSNFMAKIDFDNTVDLRFVNYLFHSLYNARLNFPYVQQTTGIQNLNVGYYLTTKVAFPPPNEQKAIADFLDRATEKIDRIIAIKQKQLERIDEMRYTEIFNACTKGLDKKAQMNEADVLHIKQYPKHWRIRKLKRGCFEIDTGSTPTSSEPEYFMDGSVEWYAPECIGENLSITRPKKLINEKAVQDNQIKMYPENSVFFVGVGATAGKVGLIRKASSCNQQINILQTNYLLLPEFLAYQLKILEKEISKFAQYTTLPILNQAKTGYIEMLFPPIKEQEEIVEYLNNYTDKLRVLRKKIEIQITTLQSYRQSLIHECVTGKKRVVEGVEKEMMEQGQ